jgi:hypothetical protein
LTPFRRYQASLRDNLALETLDTNALGIVMPRRLFAIALLSLVNSLVQLPVLAEQPSQSQTKYASFSRTDVIANSVFPLEIPQAITAPELSDSQCLLSVHGLKHESEVISLRAQTPKSDSLPVVAALSSPASKEITTAADPTTANPTTTSVTTTNFTDASAQKLTEDPPALKFPQPAPAKIPYWQTSTPFAPEGTQRRALPAPLDAVFPSTEWIGVAGQTQIGVPNTDSVYPLEAAIYKACPVLKRKRIEIYGWGNPGYGTGSSKNSNVPLSYYIVPRKPELDQFVIRIERQPDTVQQEHNDWGFRLSTIYGIDTRYTVAAGWYPASGQVLGQNRLYSWDPVECYGVFYMPKIGQRKILDGLMFKVGRYISPSDIEAQLAPDNYLWTHSQMFTVDNYTQTGILSSLKLNKNWMVQAGIHAGDDIAPWNKAAIPSGIACLRWQSNTNRDSLYFTANSFNNGHYRLADKDNGAHGHDNLNQYNITWGHRFSPRVHMMSEAYWLYEINALQGGTTISGTPRPYFKNVGAGAYLPGMSQAFGAVNYTNIKITDKDYITFRPIDYLCDPRGVRTGFRATYSTWTVGWCHRFNNLLCIRPEIRYERALNTRGNEATATPYDNGTRRSQFTIGMDLIQRF